MKTKYGNRTLCLAATLVMAAAALPTLALTPADSASLLYMKQEEKLARDVYQALAVRWDHATFRQIATSEQRHMDAIDRLIARYGLTDTTPAESGRFSIPELQKLYGELVTAGGASLLDALRVGIRIEELDIADLKVAIESTVEPMIQMVFRNLERASGHHLTAFTTVLANGGVAATSCGNGGACGRCDGQGGQRRQGRNRADCDLSGSDKGNDSVCPRPEDCPQGSGMKRGATTESGPKSSPAGPQQHGRR